MLSSMKGVKMAGLTDRLASIIQDLRLEEIASASGFRIVIVYSVIIGRSRVSTQTLHVYVTD